MTDLVASGIPYRDTFWNVPMWARVFVYVGGTAAVAVFAYGCWLRLAVWLKGKPERRTDRIPERIALMLTQALGQARTLSQAYPGVMHAIVFWGFLALFIGTVLATIDYDITLPLLHVKLLKGNFYLLYELVLDMFGLFFVIGLGMACWRRFVQRPARIDPTPKFAYALLILFVINVTGFVMEACRHSVVVLHAPRHHAHQRVLRQARASRGAGQDREHRGGGEPRGGQVRGLLLEAPARLRRLRRVRALPGRVPCLPVGERAQPQARHRETQALHARRRYAAAPRRGDPGRRALGLHHLHGLRTGMPRLHRHRGHHRGPPPLPRALRGRAALHGAARPPEHPACR